VPWAQSDHYISLLKGLSHDFVREVIH
jgi:hypothetical protein